jgi:hypothetical protein
MRIAQVLTGSLFLVGFSVAPVLAENPGAGVEAGVGISRMGPAVAGQSSTFRPGVRVGVYGRAPLTTTISIQAELAYIQKYSRLTTTSTGQTDGFKLDYLEVPILAKLPLFKGLYMLEGVSFGFVLRARAQPESGAERDIKGETRSPDLDLVIGGGVPIKQFAIEGRYDGGLRNVSTTAGASTLRNRSFSILTRFHY